MNFKILKCTYCSSSAIASEEKRHMGLVVSGMECRKEFERFWQLLKFIPAKTGGHLFLHIIYKTKLTNCSCITKFKKELLVLTTPMTLF